MSPNTLIERVDVRLGPATDSRATVYLTPRWAAGTDLGDNWRLHGELRGPRCLYAKTLASSFALRDRGPDPHPLASVEVLEPCFWTPDLPYLYDLRLEVYDGDRLIAEHGQTLGLKRWAVERGRFWLDGKPHVLRAWQRPAEAVARPTDILWGPLREARLALWCEAPTAALLAQASVQGVLVVVPPIDSPTVPFGEAAALAPAAVWLPAERVALVTPPVNSCLLCADLATIATRFDPALSAARAARAACERLQRDCAPFTNLAGYVV
ncbi:hypothetical protein [Botrimarina hoheduenensis]|uniref:Glycoside hydrolase family 2 immunoglobulin-like beta-sandwich domain-containing protein n=1 Tax=Botrimarina hoheduenensis TaxID=2528000 RepID=A0A5C5VXZ8_9BACT|nr:hypothetical protein [Botrimarina hoheduenensis]TWT43314.1 hypothetical protein Pla111_22650 [Botrimarina hoheduenensis]